MPIVITYTFSYRLKLISPAFSVFIMENYEKGEVIEVDEPPVFSLADNDITMRVSGGSKIRNVMGYAMKKIKVLIES